MRSLRIIVLASLASCALLVQSQKRPAVFGTSNDVSAAPGDQLLLDHIARLPNFDAYVDTSVITFPLDRAGELLELFRIAKSTRNSTLRHVSPVVRLYSAYHLMLTRPAAAGQLAALLTDGTRVNVASFGERLEPTSVRATTAALLCARQSEPAVAKLLSRVSLDVRMLAVWPQIYACLHENALATHL